MFRSIRWTLQLWHAGLLAVVLAGFGAASYYGIRQARFQEIDSQLERSVQLLAGSLRYPPRPWQGGPGNGPGGGGGGGGGPGMGQGGGFGPDGQGGQGMGGSEGPGGPGGFGGDGNHMQDDPGRRGPDWGPGGPPQGQFDRPGGRGGRGGRGPGGGGGPGGPRFDPMLTEIDVPPPVEQRFGDGEGGTLYYVLWDYDRGQKKTTRSAANDVPEPGTRPVMNQGPRGFMPPNTEQPQFRQRGDLREAYINGPAGWILVGKSISPELLELRRSAWLLTGIGTGVMLVGLAGGWILSLRAVRPIRAIAATAQEISATNLSRRIDMAETQSELGSLAAVLNDTFSRLDAAFQQQVRFTADASHELRTPLAVIHAHTQLALSRERTAEEYRKTIETCQRASSRMRGLVDSLLVLAKADAGRLTLERGPMELASSMQDVVTMMRPLAQEKGVTLEADLKEVTLNADATKMSQVAINLLTNAIRYNKEGGVVKVSTESRGDEAILTVEDTGVGIPDESKGHIFERFYRVDTARSREQGGSGLGLAICKSIVEGHGGTITFISEYGKGTTFTVRLPRDSAAGRPVAGETPGASDLA